MSRRPAAPVSRALDCPACEAVAKVSWAYRGATWVLECQDCGKQYAGRYRYDEAASAKKPAGAA